MRSVIAAIVFLLLLGAVACVSIVACNPRALSASDVQAQLIDVARYAYEGNTRALHMVENFSNLSSDEREEIKGWLRRVLRGGSATKPHPVRNEPFP